MHASRARSFPTNIAAGSVFALVALISFVQRAWLDGGMWSALAVVFLTSGSDRVPWQNKSAWRRAVAIIFLLLGIALLATNVILHWRR